MYLSRRRFFVHEYCYLALPSVTHAIAVFANLDIFGCKFAAFLFDK